MSTYERGKDASVDPSIARLGSYREVLEYDGLIPGRAHVRLEGGEVTVDVPNPVTILHTLVGRLRKVGSDSVTAIPAMLQRQLLSSRG